MAVNTNNKRTDVKTVDILFYYMYQIDISIQKIIIRRYSYLLHYLSKEIRVSLETCSNEVYVRVDSNRNILKHNMHNGMQKVDIIIASHAHGINNS